MIKILAFEITKPNIFICPGANPIITSYNPSVVKNLQQD
jgi:hypothetical protein